MDYDKKDFVETADSATIKMIVNARRLTRRYYMTDYSDRSERIKILTELFGKVGENVAIDVPIHCDHGKNVRIGNDVVIGMNCTFVDNAPIDIGNRVMIASNVQFYTSFHPVKPKERFINDEDVKDGIFFRTMAKAIIVEDGAWIGGGAILLPGVTIGKNSVIGAGSVVTRSVPENCVAVGNPCRVIQRIAGENE